jgi:hypothetical protein
MRAWLCAGGGKAGMRMAWLTGAKQQLARLLPAAASLHHAGRGRGEARQRPVLAVPAQDVGAGAGEEAATGGHAHFQRREHFEQQLPRYAHRTFMESARARAEAGEVARLEQCGVLAERHAEHVEEVGRRGSGEGHG